MENRFMPIPVKLFLCLFLSMPIYILQAEVLEGENLLQKNQFCLSLSNNLDSVVYYNLEHQVQAYLMLIDTCAASKDKHTFYNKLVSTIHQQKEVSISDKWKSTRQVISFILEKNNIEPNVSELRNKEINWETLYSMIQKGDVFLKPSVHQSNTSIHILQVQESNLDDFGHLSSVKLSTDPLNPLLICQNTDFLSQTLLPLSQIINSTVQNIMKEKNLSDHFTFLHSAGSASSDFLIRLNFPSLIQWQSIGSHFILQKINEVFEDTFFMYHFDEKQLQSLNLWKEINTLIKESIDQHCFTHPFLLDKNVEEFFIAFHLDHSFPEEDRKKHLASIRHFIFQDQKGASILHTDIDDDFQSLYLHLIKPSSK